ncbi:MAG: hypothetical protein ACT4P5_00495 [Armatimonadota bacterium]
MEAMAYQTRDVMEELKRAAPARPFSAGGWARRTG